MCHLYYLNFIILHLFSYDISLFPNDNSLNLLPMPKIPPYICQYFISISLFLSYFSQFIITSINQYLCLSASISNQLLILSIYFLLILLPILI